MTVLHAAAPPVMTRIRSLAAVLLLLLLLLPMWARRGGYTYTCTIHVLRMYYPLYA